MSVDAYRYTALLLGVICLLVWVGYAKRSRRWGYVVPVLLWLANVVAFWFWNMFLRSPDQFLAANAWSAVVQLQALFTLFLGGVSLLLDLRHHP